MNQEIDENIKALSLKQIYKIINTGCEIETALVALGMPVDDMPVIYARLENPPDQWWREFKLDLDRARAQSRVIMYQRIYSEGGFTGAKFLLERMERRANIKPQKQIENVTTITEYEWADE